MRHVASELDYRGFGEVSNESVYEGFGCLIGGVIQVNKDDVPSGEVVTNPCVVVSDVIFWGYICRFWFGEYVIEFIVHEDQVQFHLSDGEIGVIVEFVGSFEF